MISISCSTCGREGHEPADHHDRHAASVRAAVAHLEGADDATAWQRHALVLELRARLQASRYAAAEVYRLNASLARAA